LQDLVLELVAEVEELVGLLPAAHIEAAKVALGPVVVGTSNLLQHKNCINCSS